MTDNQPNPTDYSLWSLCYAKADMPRDFFGGAGLMSNRGTQTITMNFTLIRGGQPGEDHHYLVDCGFKAPIWFERYPFYDWEDPRTVLEKVGVTPEAIEAIFITHLHFDHINQIDEFPNARIYLQREEYEAWSMVANLPEQFKASPNPWVYSSFDPEDLSALRKAQSENRLVILEGDSEIVPGITARLRRRCHTFASCTWHIAANGGPYVVAGDTVYWYANLENMWPPGYDQGDTFELLFLYDELQTAVNQDLNRIIPGHDYGIYARHSSWKEGKNPVAEIHLAAEHAALMRGDGPARKY
jgi:glyoxylase-like metal-dependent hydrolase (beta-lactamase superfamily II)